MPMMKAAIWTAYGPPEVLQIREMPMPVPKERQLLVKVIVSNIFPGDCELRRLDLKIPGTTVTRLFCGWNRPRPNTILGQEFAGIVSAVGPAVTGFAVGDRVFGGVIPVVQAGSYAEYLLANANTVAHMPDGLSFEDAAVLTVGGVNALHVLRAAGLDAAPGGRKVLMNGACGSIGTFAVQLAKLYGHEVTAIDASHKLAKLRELGADHVIDYLQEDFTQSGRQYDVVIDLAGKCDFFRALAAVKPGGWLLLPNPPPQHALLRFVCNPFSKRHIRFPVAGFKPADIEHLKRLVTDGKLRPVVDRGFPLAQVAEGHRYIEENHRIGNVVLNVGMP